MVASLPKGSPLKIWRRCIEAKRLLHRNIDDEFGTGNINVITNCPIYMSLAKNDLYYDVFVNTGLVRTAKRGDYPLIASEIYYRLLNFFSLEPSLQAKFDSVLQKWENRYVVGMQIRVGISNSAFVDNCKFLFFSDVSTFIHYADYYSNRTTLKPLWFVSTDSPDVENLIMKKYPDRAFFLSELPMKHTGTLAYDFFEPSVQRAILDNYLLSKSNLLLTTAWSSFGEIAVGRMTNGSTIMITRSDPIKSPPPIQYIRRRG